MKTNYKHPYHLVDPSPWPLVTAIAALFSTFGIVLYIDGYETGFSLLCLGLFLLTLAMGLWWKDVIREATYEGRHTGKVQKGLRLGISLFTVSDVLFFFHSLLNLVPNHIKYNFKQLKPNKDFLPYFVCYVLLLPFTILWGIFFNDNLSLFLLGLLFSLLGFNGLINMKYPQSLKSYITREKSIYLKLKEWGKVFFLLVLFALIFSGVLAFLISNIIFAVAEMCSAIFFDHFQIFVVVYVFFITFAVGFVIYLGSKYLPNLKTNFIAVNYTRAHKKLLLFFRLYPQAKKKFFVCFLAGLSFFTQTPFLFLSFIGLSFRVDSGLTVYWLYVLCMICAFMVTLPSFRDPFFTRYQKNSLRMLGWNSPQLSAGKVAGFLLSFGCSVATGIAVNEEVKLNAQRCHDALETLRVDEHNHKVDAMRERDPQGYDKGYSEYAKLEYKPMPAPHKWKWDPSKFPWSKKQK